MKQFLIPYIMFKNSKQAADYYVTVFGGAIRYIMYGKDMPGCPENQIEQVMHLEYIVHENLFYMADADIPDNGRIHLHLNYDSRVEMEKAFNNMKSEGTVIQEIKEEFWGAVYGVIKDKFDITWQFHCRVEKE